MPKMWIRMERKMLIPYLIKLNTTRYTIPKEYNGLLNPCCCITKTGIGDVRSGQACIAFKNKKMFLIKQTKPKYKVLTMKQISKIKFNGKNVVSFFSGCGGSSLGYKMAGFNILCANEFWNVAANVYEKNFISTKVIRKSIVDLNPRDILKFCGIRKGELDVLDGSPPCQTFSMAGKRNMQDGRTDLFFEWLRMVNGIKPKIFVAENVSGMVRGTAKGQFKRILNKMKSIGYNTEAKLLDAQWLGVPQQRQRVVFIGVREDLKIKPQHPKPFKYRYTLVDACPWLLNEPYTNEYTGLSPSSVKHHIEYLKNFCKTRKLTIKESKRIQSFPDDFDLSIAGSYRKQWEVIGNSVPPLMMRSIANEILKILNNA